MSKIRTLHPVSTPGSKARPVTLPCADPATGESLGRVAAVAPGELPALVSSVREAQRRWAKTDFSARRRVLARLLDHLLDAADELVELVVRDAGKTRENAAMGEIWTVAEKLRWTIRNGERWLRPERRGTGFLLHKRARVEFEPLGVVGVICPWNYPLQNILGPTIPALMAGNGVVVKVSEHVAWSSERVQQLIDGAFEAEGVAPGLVRIVNGAGDVGAALIQSGIDQVVFTGSHENGKRVLASTANGLVPAVLELGGKDALIVCSDADIERSVQAALTGAFIAAGQNCLAAERIIVCDAVYDAFRSRFEAAVRELRVGPPRGPEVVDVGAITMPAQLDLVQELVQDAEERGARVLVGGKRRPGVGQFFEPTALDGVTPDMRIFREETFGPVACLIRARDEAHAVELANDCQYGLGCTIMTQDRQRAARMIAQLRVGCVSVNDFALSYMAQALPFGGVGGSGFGRLNGPEGLRGSTVSKAVIEDRFPWAPTASIYPVQSGDHARVLGAVRLLYGRGLARKWSAAKGLLAAIR